jgi:pantoate--beta-alanine ligase
MKLLRTVAEARAWRAGAGDRVGAVPTMGYLHDGHLSLVRESRRHDAVTVATIFVNPTQFAPNEDLSRYPRDEARDLALLEGEGVAAVFMPSVEDMYPAGYGTYVVVEGLTQRLEGASRPAHFRGVTTVVAKLLNILQPQRAYFGHKDAQQLAVVRRMVRDLDLPVEIIGMPIVRESDGLALSSRNVYLTPEQRRAALVLSRSLAAARDAFAAGERDAGRLRQGQHRPFAHVADALHVAQHLRHREPQVAHVALRQRWAARGDLVRHRQPQRRHDLGRRRVRHLLRKGHRSRAVELELQERPHDGFGAALLERAVQPHQVAGRLHVLLHDLHRQHLAHRRRLHHERAEHRLSDDAAAGDAELGVAGEEVGVTHLHEQVEAGGTARRRGLSGMEGQGPAAVAADGFECVGIGHRCSLNRERGDVKRRMAAPITPRAGRAVAAPRCAMASGRT